MNRILIAGLTLALSASTALAGPTGPISFNTPYIYETSSSTPAASGTTVSPPLGGLGNFGGLCQPGATGCPALPTAYVSELGPLTTGYIQIQTPSLSSNLRYELTINVSDDSLGAHAIGYPADTYGDIFEVILGGKSLGVTSVVGITTDPGFSGGAFSVPLAAGTYELGITDLLQPYANGLTDTLPGTLCAGVASADPACSSPPNGGIVHAGTYGSNILDFEATISLVPEPGSMALLGCGIVALGLVSRRRPA
jgi:hypothetical protein